LHADLGIGLDVGAGEGWFVTRLRNVNHRQTPTE
jgi:hypothetical protein